MRLANGQAVFLHEREMGIKLPLAFPSNLQVCHLSRSHLKSYAFL